MTEHIEHARELNRQVYDDISHGRLDAAELHASPIGVPSNVPAVWCEIVD